MITYKLGQYLVKISFSSSWEKGIEDGVGVFDCAWVYWVGLDLFSLSLLIIWQFNKQLISVKHQ